MKILVPIDDSVFAENAMDKAIELANLASSKVIFLNVAPLPGAIEEMSAGISEKIRQSGKAILESARKRAGKKGIEVETVLEEGVSPANNIILFAEENDIDMIVLGYRGRANLEKFLLGSVALRVVSHAPCSVMVVK